MTTTTVTANRKSALRSAWVRLIARTPAKMPATTLGDEPAVTSTGQPNTPRPDGEERRMWGSSPARLEAAKDSPLATITAEPKLRLGKRRDVRMHVAENEDLNVLGMNFLSSLKRWGVEGRWLVLIA